MERKHLVKKYEAELQEIRILLLEMGGKVEVMISNAIQALVNRDSSLADRTITVRS